MERLSRLNPTDEFHQMESCRGPLRTAKARPNSTRITVDTKGFDIVQVKKLPDTTPAAVSDGWLITPLTRSHAVSGSNSKTAGKTRTANHTLGACKPMDDASWIVVLWLAFCFAAMICVAGLCSF